LSSETSEKLVEKLAIRETAGLTLVGGGSIPPPFSSETFEKLVKFFLNVTIAKALFGKKLLKMFLNVMIAKALSC
jgi:hypothetical protein